MLRDDWKEVNKSNPCKICGKPDWCIYSIDGSAAICNRVSDGAARISKAGGFVHLLNREVHPGHRFRIPPVPKRIEGERVCDWDEWTKWFMAQAVGKVAKMAVKMAEREDGLPPLPRLIPAYERSLTRLRVGLAAAKTWTFPMVNGKGRIVGIRTRNEVTKEKRCVGYGGHSGLFVASDLNGGPVYVCEGPTDTAATLTLGLDVLGRASCGEGAVELQVMVTGRIVIVVADNDRPGRDGAARLAKALPTAKSVRVVQPPEQYKDVRKWVNAGATRKEVEAL